MTEDEFEKNWTKRGFSFSVGSIKLQEEVKDAVHDDQDELIVMVNGKLEVTIGGETFIPDRNQEVLIPAKSNHSIKNIGAVDSIIYFGYKQTDS